MSGCAELQRTVVVVVALLTAGSAPALAREFHVADSRNQDYAGIATLRFIPAMNEATLPFLFRSIEPMQKMPDGPMGNASLATGAMTSSPSFATTGFAMTFIHAGAPRDMAAANPIETIRSVE